MKLLTSLLLTLLASTTVLASIDPQDLTVQSDPTSQTMIVRTIIPLEQDAALTLTDRNGRVVYKDSVPAGDFINKRFPLKVLNCTEYRLTISDRRGETVQPIRPQNKERIANPAEASRRSFPSVDLHDERTLVVGYANQTGKRVQIRIDDQKGKTVLTDEVDGTTVQRSYQLNRLTSGNYRVTINARDVKNYSTAIALR